MNSRRFLRSRTASLTNRAVNKHHLAPPSLHRPGGAVLLKGRFFEGSAKMGKQGKKYRRLWNAIESDENTKDLFRVWFSYLIRTPFFQTYLSYLRSGKSIYQSKDSSEEFKNFCSGYHEWFYNLLPKIWDQNPSNRVNIRFNSSCQHKSIKASLVSLPHRKLR